MSDEPKHSGWVVVQAGYCVGPFSTEDAALAYAQKFGDLIGVGIFKLVSKREFAEWTK